MICLKDLVVTLFLLLVVNDGLVWALANASQLLFEMGWGTIFQMSQVCGLLSIRESG